MQNTGNLDITTPSDREIVMTRVFNAPRRMVYQAFTRPELIQRWLGPRGWTLPTCEVDLRVGGKYRYVGEGPDGTKLGWGGIFKEIVPEQRIAHVESFDDYPGEAQITSEWTESGGKTTFTATMLYESKEVRDAVIASGMEHGAAESYDRLEEMLAEGKA
jgi:uncharacterized protein YndB with AHSA1/START domain